MEAELDFEREKRSGVVPVDTYLFDAARRLGVEVEAECGRRGACESCAVRVKSGEEFLSEITTGEKEHLTAKRRKSGERLSCQAKIEGAGEIVIMTHKKKEETKADAEVKTEEYRKQFEELPLEKKVASLLELESITLSETLSFVVNSPSHIVGKIMDVMAEFGFKLDEREKDAKRPKEHKAKGKTDAVRADEDKETRADENSDDETNETAEDAKRQTKKSGNDKNAE